MNPSIYYYGTYYGQFNNYTVMAMILLDPKFPQDLEEEKITELDFLVACREYVSQKYVSFMVNDRWK